MLAAAKYILKNGQRELARSQYADDKRLAVFKMVEQINLQTKISTEFLELLSNQMLNVETKELLEESKDIWNNIKFAKDDSPSESESDDERVTDDKESRAGAAKQADKDIMMFERDIDQITKKTPSRR